MFRRDLANPALANSADPANGGMTIHCNSAGRDEYQWRWADGRALGFDQRGKLVQIKASTGEILSLLYDATGMLVKVITRREAACAWPIWTASRPLRPTASVTCRASTARSASLATTARHRRKSGRARRAYP